MQRKVLSVNLFAFKCDATRAKPYSFCTRRPSETNSDILTPWILFALYEERDKVGTVFPVRWTVTVGWVFTAPLPRYSSEISRPLIFSVAGTFLLLRLRGTGLEGKGVKRVTEARTWFSVALGEHKHTQMFVLLRSQRRRSHGLPGLMWSLSDFFKGQILATTGGGLVREDGTPTWHLCSSPHSCMYSTVQYRTSLSSSL